MTQFQLIDLGQIMIATFYLTTGIYNLYFHKSQIERLEETIIPFPKLAFSGALILQLGGGILLFINKFVIVGALMEILFTILASLFFMRFWEHLYTNPEKAKIQFLFLIEHFAVLGGLFMIIGLHS